MTIPKTVALPLGYAPKLTATDIVTKHHIILFINEKLVDEVLAEDPLGAPSLGAERTRVCFAPQEAGNDNTNSSTKTSISRFITVNQ